ncbi:hypothetical protein [Thalassobius sp. MITS945101]|uniref:hypothetical protein n=1 Tax=Thalassobius sp. MITS945101 TaxID=3096994 RepID=UPI00399AA29E
MIDWVRIQELHSKMGATSAGNLIEEGLNSLQASLSRLNTLPLKERSGQLAVISTLAAEIGFTAIAEAGEALSLIPADHEELDLGALETAFDRSVSLFDVEREVYVAA